MVFVSAIVVKCSMTNITNWSGNGVGNAIYLGRQVTRGYYVLDLIFQNRFIWVSSKIIPVNDHNCRIRIR